MLELEINKGLFCSCVLNNHPNKCVIKSYSKPFVFACIQDFKTMLLIALQPFDHYHRYNIQVSRVYERFVRQEETVTCSESTKLHHSANVFPCLCHGFCPKDDPTKDSKEECEEDLEGFSESG